MRRAAIGLLAAVLLLHGCGGGEPDCAQAPDFAGWKAATKRTTILSERYEDKRREVAEHLVSCGSLRGASKAEVLRRLGRSGLPDPKEPNDDPDGWVFPLGPDGLGIDSENLYVRFDARGRAARFTVGQS
jgi:hypothetical protein